MISTPLIYHFMDARTFYRIIFVGNEPYKNRREELNDLKRWAYQNFGKLQDDDGWNILMAYDLYRSMKDYVRKSISGVFRILIFKISESKLEFQNPRSRNFS